jgi:S1-C subfamily serine protease
MKKLLGILVLGLSVILFGCVPIEDPVLDVKGAAIIEAKSFEVTNCKAIKETKAMHADWHSSNYDIKQAKIKIRNETVASGGTHFVVTFIDIGVNVGSAVGRVGNVVYATIYDCKQKTQTTKAESKSEGPSSGTAFFIDNKGHLVTNYHVVKSCNNKSKIIYKTKEINAELIAKDDNLDLALLKADIKNEYFISISEKPPNKLQKIIAAGYPFGKFLSDDLKFTSGIISSLKGLEDDSTRLQIDAALNYGNSGGPIVDEDTGELVAVAVAGLRKDITEAVNFGIKAASVKNFLESNQMYISLVAKKYNLKSEELSLILENATIYTFCN